jgi:N-acyl-D-amino-acid deacylase
LVRFASAFDDPAHCRLLEAETIATMFARPPGQAGLQEDGKPKAAYYGCGWQVRPQAEPGQVIAWHHGALSGTSTLLLRRHDGLAWAVLFNSRFGKDGKLLSAQIDPLLHVAAREVQEWPEGDLFEKRGRE